MLKLELVEIMRCFYVFNIFIFFGISASFVSVNSIPSMFTCSVNALKMWEITCRATKCRGHVALLYYLHFVAFHFVSLYSIVLRFVAQHFTGIHMGLNWQQTSLHRTIAKIIYNWTLYQVIKSVNSALHMVYDTCRRLFDYPIYR